MGVPVHRLKSYHKLQTNSRNVWNARELRPKDWVRAMQNSK